MAANGVELATAYVSLTVDGSKVDAGVRRSLSGVDAQADAVGKSSGKKMGAGMSAGILGAAARVAGPLAAVFAGIKIGQILGDSIDEAIEAQKVSAATDAILKATGGVAKVSASQVSDLSGSLSELIGVDDEIIQNSANLLLTFKNIRNEAGKNNDIFNQSVKTAQDLSAAGFGSIESASKTLGKALNDPIKGVTALTRAGVQFSDAQKKQIANMVKSGDLLGAQKLILAEVQSQVGGVAEATATTSEKVNVAWKNVEEEIGTALLPMLERLGRWFLDEGLPAIKEFGGWVKDELWPAISEGWKTIQPGLEQARQIFSDAFGDGGGGGDVKSFASFLTDTLIPGIATFVNVWLPVMAAGWAGVGKAAEAAGFLFSAQATVVRTVSTVIITAFTNVLNTAADMLDVLSRVPGFGWAADLADDLRGVANKANDVKNAINNIPSHKTVTVSVNYVSSFSGRFDPAPTGYTPGRAHGGPVRKGQPYIVGEKRPELFVPNQDGRIVPRVPGSASGSVAEGDVRDTRLARLIGQALSEAPLWVGVSDVDRSMKRRNRFGALSPSGA